MTCRTNEPITERQDEVTKPKKTAQDKMFNLKQCRKSNKVPSFIFSYNVMIDIDRKKT